MEIPKIENIEVHRFRLDKTNPNVMSVEKFEALKKNIKKFGFIVPVITNNEMEVADGEHRLKAAKELGYREVPTIRLDIKDVDRRILRQVLNKLTGKHNPGKDEADFSLIVDNGGREDLKELLAMSEDELINLLKDKEKIDFVPPITPEYLEEYNYVVVFFENSLDWEVGKELFGLKKVRTVEPEDKYKKVRTGEARVVKGSEFLKRVNK